MKNQRELIQSPNIYIYIYIYILSTLVATVCLATVCLATLKSSDKAKQSVCDKLMTIYTLPHGVEHSGERIFGPRSHNAKLFERIEHSGSREGIKM